MIRRTVAPIGPLVLALLAAPLAAEAQPAATVPRIGLLDISSLAARASLWEAFRQGMRELGYVEGRTVVFEARGADGKRERLPALAAELVRLKVDVSVTAGAAAQAARQATATIPIVMASGGDPVGPGLVASLARPGGNVTGVTTLSVELSPKRFYLADRIVVLTPHPGTVRAELPISLPRMRDPLRVEFLDYQREVIAHLTASPARR